MSEKSSGSVFSRIKQALEAYIEAKAHLFQLQTTEKVAMLMGMMSIVVLAVLLITLFILFISLMTGYYFSQLFDSFFYGFALVAGFYLVMLIILIIFRKKLATFITNKVLEAIFNKTAEKQQQA